MKIKSIALAFAAALSSTYAFAGNATLSVIDMPSTTGSIQVKSGYNATQGAFQSYDTTGNIAFGKTVSVSGTIAGYPTIHAAQFLTDGAYGNGSSWIGNAATSSFVVDLGSLQNVNSVMFGRDRLGYFNDRDPGVFNISLSSNGSSFTSIYTSSNGYTINGNDSVKVSFDATSSRYVKLSFANGGAAIDEIQITAAVPEPETYAMLLAGLGLMGAVARRKQK